MACNQECMVENEKIVLIERLAFIERGTFLLHFRLFCAYTTEIFLCLYFRLFLDYSVKKYNFVGLWKLNKILTLLSQTP